MLEEQNEGQPDSSGATRCRWDCAIQRMHLTTRQMAATDRRRMTAWSSSASAWKSSPTRPQFSGTVPLTTGLFAPNLQRVGVRWPGSRRSSRDSYADGWSGTPSTRRNGRAGTSDRLRRELASCWTCRCVPVLVQSPREHRCGEWVRRSLGRDAGVRSVRGSFEHLRVTSEFEPASSNMSCQHLLGLVGIAQSDCVDDEVMVVMNASVVL